jgi:phosphoserine phosphatase RsbU/P
LAVLAVLVCTTFSERPAFDRRRSWLKWVLLIPLILQSVSFVVFVLASDYEFAALAPLRPLLDQFPLHTYLTFVAISAFFALLGMKSATGGTAEVRRRLRILYFGTAFSLTPMLIAAIIGMVRERNILNGIPPWATITALLALLLFPLIWPT